MLGLACGFPPPSGLSQTALSARSLPGMPIFTETAVTAMRAVASTCFNAPPHYNVDEADSLRLPLQPGFTKRYEKLAIKPTRFLSRLFLSLGKRTKKVFCFRYGIQGVIWQCGFSQFSELVGAGFSKTELCPGVICAFAAACCAHR